MEVSRLLHTLQPTEGLSLPVAAPDEFESETAAAEKEEVKAKPTRGSRWVVSLILGFL